MATIKSWRYLERSALVDNTDFVIVPERTPQMQDHLPEVFKLHACNGHDMYEISIDELQHLLTSGDLTSLQYVAFCLERIRRVRG